MQKGMKTKHSRQLYARNRFTQEITGGAQVELPRKLLVAQVISVKTDIT